MRTRIWMMAAVPACILTLATNTEAQTASDPPPAVPVRVAEALKHMSDYIGSAAEFTVHAAVTFDHVLPSGQKLQYAAAEDVAVKRPGHLFIQWSGDLGDRRLWYDGKTVTLQDPSTPFYAAEAAPGGIDTMLDAVEGKLGFTPPLADLLYSNPYRAVAGNIQAGLDLGTTAINGQTCRSLAFVGRVVDWQIWISEGPQLTPCKLVITYKAQPGQPQFSATFTDWNFAPRIAEPIFTPVLPAGAERIDFAPAFAAMQAK